MRSCCVFDSPRLSLPLLAVYFLPYRLYRLPSLQLLLPRSGGQIPCALPLVREKKWYSTHEYSPQGEWDRGAEQMMVTFAESKHPVFRSTSPSSRGVLKSKGGGKLSMYLRSSLRYM